jgi:hypothetical protein
LWWRTCLTCHLSRRALTLWLRRAPWYACSELTRCSFEVMSAQIGSPMKMVNFEYKTEMIIEHPMYGLLLLNNSLHKSKKILNSQKDHSMISIWTVHWLYSQSTALWKSTRELFLALWYCFFHECSRVSKKNRDLHLISKRAKSQHVLPY